MPSTYVDGQILHGPALTTSLALSTSEAVTVATAAAVAAAEAAVAAAGAGADGLLIPGVLSASFGDGGLVFNLADGTTATFFPDERTDPIAVLPAGIAPHSQAVINVAPNTIWPNLQVAQLGLADGGLINVAAGLYQRSVHFDATDYPSGFTIIGAGAYLTVNDGRYGVGAGHRLAFGKGIIHTDASPVLIKNMGFVRGGGGDGVSDAESGIYFQHLTGTNTVENCAFDDNEDGIYCASLGVAAAVLHVTNCDFGLNIPNGHPNDGLSHDMYVAPHTVVCTNNRHYNCERGHGLKARAPNVSTTGCYFHHNGGRAVDLPNGTATVWTSTNDVFTDDPNCSTNYIGYGNEGASLGTAGALFTNATIGWSRYNQSFWVVGSTFTFTSCTVLTKALDGYSPPSFQLLGDGTLVGWPAIPMDGNDALPTPPTSPLL